MSNLASVQKPTFEYKLKIESGPKKGLVYKLVSNRITIGRGKQNDICLQKDEHCSREHAIIEVLSSGIFIRNLSSTQKIAVNSKEVEKALLFNKSIIQLGQTTLSFHIFEKNNLSNKSQFFINDLNKQNSMPNKKGKKKLTFYLIVGTISMFFCIYFEFRG